MSRRPSVQRRQREWEQCVAEQNAARAKREAIAELGAFIMDADEHTLGLVEQFGVTALRAQWSENAQSSRAEAQDRIRGLMAATLKIVAEDRAHSARFVLYTEERRRWASDRTPLGDPGMSIEYTTRSAAVRRRQSERELAKLGIRPEYVNPNEAAGDGA